MSVNFRVDIRVGTRKDTLELLKKAGCDVVGFGVETGSDKLLKIAGKGVSRRQVLETIQVCKDLGFWIIGFFIYFFPNEEEHDRRQTMDLFKYFDVLEHPILQDLSGYLVLSGIHCGTGYAGILLV